MKPNPPGQKPTKHQQRIEDKAKAKRSLSVLHSVDPSSQLTDLSTTVQSGTSSSQPTITQYVQPMCIVMAEIRWAMKVVLSHHSFRSCLDINDLFSSMFPDSCIAKKFAMSKTKCAYCINYGLAPFYKEKLLSEIKKSPYYTIMFDESLNKILQKDQMDVYRRYWYGESNQVKTMYFDTRFFFRPNADTITKNICEVLKPLTKEEMINLGMDSPSTNWTVLRLIQDARIDDAVPPLEDIGSCGLHVISGALQTGVTDAGWSLKKGMQAMYNLFLDSPARRDLYIKLNESTTFALKFCPTRWVENERVAEIALEVWDYHVKVVKQYMVEPVSKRPSNFSFKTLVENYTDKFMKVILEIFREVARKASTHLTLFQTDNPMLPFLSDTLENLLRRIMGYFVSRSELDKATTPLKLVKLDVSISGDKCLNISDIKLPTGANSRLKKLKLNTNQKQSFFEGISILFDWHCTKISREKSAQVQACSQRLIFKSFKYAE